jgi:hypothetical protein
MVKNGKTDLALMSQSIEYIKTDIREIKSKMEADYITREEFDPIKKIVYGLVTLLLTGLVGALMKLVFLK